MLLQIDGRGGRENATALLDEALSLGLELGMPPLMERVVASRDILKVRRDDE